MMTMMDRDNNNDDDGDDNGNDDNDDADLLKTNLRDIPLYYFVLFILFYIIIYNIALWMKTI